jgi:hypothetical protein
VFQVVALNTTEPMHKLVVKLSGVRHPVRHDMITLRSRSLILSRRNARLSSIRRHLGTDDQEIISRRDESLSVSNAVSNGSCLGLSKVPTVGVIKGTSDCTAVLDVAAYSWLVSDLAYTRLGLVIDVVPLKDSVAADNHGLGVGFLGENWAEAFGGVVLR